MLLSKPVYESLPYVYLMAGFGVIAFSDGLVWTGGVVLFVAGSVIWVMRSCFRRTNKDWQVQRDWVILDDLYELAPFAYLLTAILAKKLLEPSLLLDVAAFVLAVCGLLILYLRSKHRRCDASLSKVVDS